MDKFDEMIENCPLLEDPLFLARYPGIVDVACILEVNAREEYENKGEFEPFDKLGVKDLKGYLEILNQGKNLYAKHIYNTMKG